MGKKYVESSIRKMSKLTKNQKSVADKVEAGKYDGKYMSGSYLRPFTVEFSAEIKF